MLATIGMRHNVSEVTIVAAMISSQKVIYLVERRHRPKSAFSEPSTHA